MELIIKPTELCNFACTFCSSTDLVDDKKSLLDHDQIFEFLKQYPETQTIIVNGGDPLVLPPSYYWKIIDFLDEQHMATTLSFTTNLWDFYKNPLKWKDLFRHRRVGVATSFNYGGTRRISKKKVFTETIFLDVVKTFHKHIGYKPDFISVITEENYDDAIKNVELAKRLNVECKLNYAMASGLVGRPLQLSRIYQLYLEIIERGLHPWEFNSKELIMKINGGANICPRNRTCDETIRCLQPEGDYYSCGSFGDDKEFAIDFKKEMRGEKQTPLQDELDILTMRTDCYSCPMFEICNGCKKTVRDHKRSEMVEDHCRLMKQLAPNILELNGNNKLIFESNISL